MVLKLMNIELTNSAIHARLILEADIRSGFMMNAASADMVQYFPPFPPV